MFEKIDKLENISCNLTRACSLAEFVTDYFKTNNPDSATLLTRYRKYGDMHGVVLDILIQEIKEINEVYESLFDSLKKLKGVGA